MIPFLHSSIHRALKKINTFLALCFEQPINIEVYLYIQLL